MILFWDTRTLFVFSYVLCVYFLRDNNLLFLNFWFFLMLCHAMLQYETKFLSVTLLPWVSLPALICAFTMLFSAINCCLNGYILVNNISKVFFFYGTFHMIVMNFQWWTFLVPFSYIWILWHLVFDNLIRGTLCFF